MNQRLLFLIFNGEIKFLTSNIMDHREWYKSLGGTDDDYDKVIRGFVLDNKIIFVRGPKLSYDSEVVEMAKQCGPLIRQQLGNPDLIICCGVVPGENGDKWEPLMVVKEEPPTVPPEAAPTGVSQPANLGAQTAGKIIEFSSKFDDPMFVMYAVRFSLILIIVSILNKMILIARHRFSLDNTLLVLLMFAQLIGLFLSIRAYKKNDSKFKIYGLITSASSFLMLNFVDIIIGSLNLIFIVDQTIIVTLMKAIEDAYRKFKATRKK